MKFVAFVIISFVSFLALSACDIEENVFLEETPEIESIEKALDYHLM